MKKASIFTEEYKKLNQAQKSAVEAIDGPVMVIAGPGTGKTQVLSLRIANILEKTDTPADGILCLTFTNSGVRAMRERLQRLLGPRSTQVAVSTFHSFSASLIDEFYEHLGLTSAPQLLDERDSILLADQLLEEGEWQYLRPRSGGAHNFRDLKSLISFLKREGIAPGDFKAMVEAEIRQVEEDPENISSRGKSKGALKAEALGKIERLKRTWESAEFYAQYEALKRERNKLDYDDILELACQLVSNSEDARASVLERYLYVLVDEHQDSSGVQNRFLEAVWGKVEEPNLFVVGDDRQLIYGFGGASLAHFESFRETFGGKLITLTDNYRSTQEILDLADQIFESALATAKLKSQSQAHHPIRLVEAEYQRDEILRAGLEIKALVAKGVSPESCAILVPKNYQVKSAVAVLSDLGLPVAKSGKTSFFNSPETLSLIRALRVVSEPFNQVYLADFLLDKASGIEGLEAQRLLHSARGKLVVEEFPKLKKLVGSQSDVYELVQRVAQAIFFETNEQETLLNSIESVRTMLHLALSRIERNPKLSLLEFLRFVDRLEEYGEDPSLAVFGGGAGVKVMTLHASKGLEFEYVWLAHLDEKSLMRGKSAGFTLPTKVASFANKKSEEEVRRELYVGVTRAKKQVTLSYATHGYTGGELELSKVIAQLPEEMLEKHSAEETEQFVLKADPLAYVNAVETVKGSDLEFAQTLVKENFENTPVSVTHLNNFLTCPWRWYFRNFLRLPEPESETLLFGSFVHALVEESVKQRRVIDEFEPILDKMRIFNPILRARFTREADKALKTFGQEILPHIADKARTEFSLKAHDEATGLALTGKIDLLEDDEGVVRVTDFKTGQPKASEDYLRQLAMYELLLQSSKLKYGSLNNRLVFLEAKKHDDIVFEPEVGLEEVTQLKGEIAEYYKSLKSGEWVGRECQFKTNQFERECQYCALKKRLFK